jgi:hypothetical protein
MGRGSDSQPPRGSMMYRGRPGFGTDERVAAYRREQPFRFDYDHLIALLLEQDYKAVVECLQNGYSAIDTSDQATMKKFLNAVLDRFANRITAGNALSEVVATIGGMLASHPTVLTLAERQARPLLKSLADVFALTMDQRAFEAVTRSALEDRSGQLLQRSGDDFAVFVKRAEAFDNVPLVIGQALDAYAHDVLSQDLGSVADQIGVPPNELTWGALRKVIACLKIYGPMLSRDETLNQIRAALATEEE